MAAEDSWLCAGSGAGEVCGQTRVLGESVCSVHLGPSEGAKRCGYVANRNSRQCSVWVGKGAGGKEGLCPAHAHLVTQVRRRAARKTQLSETPEVIAENLAHYAQWGKDQGSLPKPESISSIPAQNKTRLHRPRLDYFSDGSDDSEDESVSGHRLNPAPLPPPSHPDDPLRHAGVLTAEEVLRISRDKLLNLQGLYKEYLGVLGQKLRLSVQRERIRGKDWEGAGPSRAPNAYREARERERLSALRRYGRVSKAESLVEKRAMRERRLRAGLPVEAERKREACEAAECGEGALPSASFCLRHILQQDDQLLFAECATAECTTPVPPFASIRHCWLHRPIPTSPPWAPPSPSPLPLPPASSAPTLSTAAPILSPSIPPPQPSNQTFNNNHQVSSSLPQNTA